MRRSRHRHILWIIRNHPAAEVAGLPQMGLVSVIDGEAYLAACQCWREQAEAHSENVAVLGNAAAFLLIEGRNVAEELLLKAEALEPDNPHWSERLGFLYQLDLRSAESAELRRDVALRSLQQYEDALSLCEKERDRPCLLGEVAKAAFEAGELKKSRSHVEELMKLTSRYGWNYGEMMHLGHTILGRLALREDDLDRAREHLVQAGEVPGSIRLNSRGPYMILAKELLERGEQEAVLEYLELSSNFWLKDKGKLKEWKAIIEEGSIPDFGKNLYC